MTGDARLHMQVNEVLIRDSVSVLLLRRHETSGAHD